MTLEANDLRLLKAAFSRADHEFKQGYVYLTEDAITNRIEEVDPAWSFEIQRMDRINDQTIVCARMTIKDVSREGVGMQLVTSNSNAEPEKGAATDALKRCARLFGIGRYLLNAPKEGGDFDKWLSAQQKALNGVVKPPVTSNGHESDSVPAGAPSAKVVGVQPTRPTPPPASPAADPDLSGASASGTSDDPIANYGQELGAVITATRPDDVDLDLYHCDRLKVNKTRTATQYILAVVKSATRIIVDDVTQLEGLTLNGVPIIELGGGEYPLMPTWSVRADTNGRKWEVHKITADIPV